MSHILKYLESSQELFSLRKKKNKTHDIYFFTEFPQASGSVCFILDMLRQLVMITSVPT